MSNLSDKEMDRLSREAADFYEPDDSSLSWSRLEQKLTEQMPERPPDSFRIGRFSPYMWATAVVLCAGISFFIIKNFNYSNHSTLKSQQIKQSVSPATSNNKGANPHAIRKDSLSSAETLRSNENGIVPEREPALPANTESGKNNIKISGNESDKLHDRNGVSKELDVSGKTNAKNLSKGRNNNISGNNAAAKNSGSTAYVPASLAAVDPASGGKDKPGSQDIAGDTYNPNESGAANDISGSNRNKNKISLPALITAGAGAGIVKGNDDLLNQMNRANLKTPNKSLHINRSLNFGLAFGPDYTNAGGIENNQIGNNIGLTVGYYLTSKLSVNSGIIYSNRFYWSPGHGSNQYLYVSGPSQYANAATFAAPPPVEYVNGSSNMWELPLTLRYDFARNHKTKFFANAGLSSYFIMKQTNIYYFQNGQRAAAWKTSNNEQINYWFGMADISLGVETAVGKGFSFQMEPYFKIPLKTMGVENLKLQSYGFLISLRYSPVLSRTKK